MRTTTDVIATTRVDAHGEALATEGVQLLLDRMNSECIPMWVQHDPRVPPVGRFVRAEAQDLPDGELAVVATAERWDPGEEVPFLPNRSMPLGRPEHDRPFISFDHTFSEEAEELEALATILGSDPNREIRKALDPITILTLGGTFALGAIASGFFGQIGADAYNSVKEKVQGIVRRRRESLAISAPHREVLFLFKAFVEEDSRMWLVDVILTNPSDEDLAWLFESGLTRLDAVLPMALRGRPDIQRLVLEVSDRSLAVSFGVRSDAVPVPVRASTERPPDRS